jgi:cytidine deaminase
VFERDSLIRAAREARDRAYAPYSQYFVGAAIRSVEGDIYQGCNVENASYPAGICAERVALVKAVSEGVRAFDSICVVTRDGGAPCGICRQMLYEFAPQMRVIIARVDGQVEFDGALNELLPLGFGPSHLLPD